MLHLDQLIRLRCGDDRKRTLAHVTYSLQQQPQAKALHQPIRGALINPVTYAAPAVVTLLLS